MIHDRLNPGNADEPSAQLLRSLQNRANVRVTVSSTRSALEQCRECPGRLNALADFPATMGNRLATSFTITKLAPLARTTPEDLARTATVALPHDYLNVRLTGTIAAGGVTELTLAALGAVRGGLDGLALGWRPSLSASSLC